MSEATSASLLLGIQDTENNIAWRRFWEIYRPFLERMLVAQKLSKADVDDVVQEVMRAVVASLPDFRHNGQVGAFRNWLRRITSHRLQEFWRQRKRAGTQESSEGGLAEQLADPDSDLSRSWNEEHDRFVLQRLLTLVQDDVKESTYAAFRLTFLEERSLSEAAQDLGMTPNAVAIARTRVLARLRELGAGLLDV